MMVTSGYDPTDNTPPARETWVLHPLGHSGLTSAATGRLATCSAAKGLLDVPLELRASGPAAMVQPRVQYLYD